MWFVKLLIKIQSLGLAKEYKNYGSVISKWLTHIFGLAFLQLSDVGNSFAEDLVPNMPDDKENWTVLNAYELSQFLTTN
jgi:hypothetical protein